MKEDRRIRKTKSSIKQAFTKLLQEKDLEKITIRDITTRADIDRGTFYLHYEDKYMLLADMEDEYISELTTYTQFDLLRGSSIEDIANTFVNNILKNIFQHIHDNLEFYHTILQLERTSQLELKINEHIKNNMQRYISINHSIGGVCRDVFLRVTFPEQQFQLLILGNGQNSPFRFDELTKHVHNIILMVH